MKQLFIYQTDENVILDGINEINHSFRKEFTTVQKLVENGLIGYDSIISDYELNIQDVIDIHRDEILHSLRVIYCKQIIYGEIFTIYRGMVTKL